MKNKLKMDLQMFGTDPVESTEPVEPPTEPIEPKEPTEPKEPEKTFTQSELEAIVAQRVAREQKTTEKAVEQAKRLAKMNEEERAEEELRILKEELEQLKQKDAYYGLSKEASKMLTEQGIQADDDLLQLVVKEDADATKQSVTSFVELINRKVEEGVQKALSGKAPRITPNSKQVVTQEQFEEMGYSERLALKQKNEELYNQLNK